MSLIRKIFGIKSNSEEEHKKSDARSKYMPEIKLPIDERFTVKFKNNGGKFLYCENFDEVRESLTNILKENDWQEKPAYIIDPRLSALFKDFNLHTTPNSTDGTFFLSTCEYLISDDGSLLISSNQIAEKKLKELPDNFIIYATTSQFVESIGEGLSGIKDKSREKIPTNITTIRHFMSSQEDKDFLTYGSSSKNLYLLLLEDL